MCLLYVYTNTHTVYTCIHTYIIHLPVLVHGAVPLFCPSLLRVLIFAPPLCQDPTLEFLRKFTIGLVSGTISSCVNIPFDVAKSRIQGPQPVPGEIKYRTCFQTMALVSREEGYEPEGQGRR